MATVPQYEIGQVKDRAVSGGFQQIQTNSDAFGASIAQANIERGNAISQLGDQAWQIATQQRDKHDQAVLKDSDNNLQSFIRDQLDVDGAFLSLKGKNALSAKGNVEKLIQDYYKTLSKDIDPRIIEQWKTVANQRINSALGRIDTHSRRETDVYYSNVSDSRISGALFDAVTNYENEKDRAKYIQFGLNEVDQKIERQLGISPDTQDEDEKATLEKFRLDFTSQAHSGIVEKLLADDRYDAAEQYYMSNKSAIKADVRLALEKAIESNTRDGQVRDAVMEIWNTPGLSDTQQIEKAEKITDAALSALVIQDLKTKQTYRDQEEFDDFEDADNEAQTLVTNNGIVSLDQIPKELYNKMSPGKREELKQYFIGEEIRVRTANEDAAARNVYSQYGLYLLDNTQPLPTTAEILKMSGKEIVTFFDKRESDAQQASTQDESDAYKAAKKLQSTGTPYNEIPQDLIDAMTGDQLDIIKDRYKVLAERLETQAYEEGLMLIANGQEVPQLLLVDMDGIQRLNIKKELAAADRSREGIAYDKLLKHLLIPGNTLENAPEGLTDQVSGEHMTSITNALGTSRAAQAKIDNDILQLTNYNAMLKMARQAPEQFAQYDLQTLIGKVSETNWKSLDKMQSNPGGVDSVVTRRNLVYQTLAGLQKNDKDRVFTKKMNITTLSTESSDKGDDVRGFITEVDRRVESFSIQNGGREPTDAEFNQILSDVAMDKVFYDEGPNGAYPASFIDVDEREDAYIRQGGEEINLDIVPMLARQTIIEEMEAAGQTVTEKAIIENYQAFKANQFDLSINLEM